MGLAAVLRPHSLADLPSLVRRDLPVAIGVGHVEMPEGRRLCFLEGDAAVLVGIRHFEHMAAEIVHADAAELASLAATSVNALLALGCVSIPFRTTDCSVTVAIHPLERPLAAVFKPLRELRAVRSARARIGRCCAATRAP